MKKILMIIMGLMIMATTALAGDAAVNQRVTDVQKTLYEEGLLRAESDTIIQHNAKVYTDYKVRKEATIREIIDNNLAKGIDRNTKSINNNEEKIDRNAARIESNRLRTDRVEEKANENGAMSLATAHALSINNLDAGDSALGAGIGIVENAQAISFAVKHQVDANLGVSVSVAGSQSGSEKMRTSYGAGMSLRF